jgi:predicted AAA+ superfamily ATPase
LLKNITQSLAGRTVLLKLLPFSIQEIKSMTKNFDADDFLYFGFYPGVYKEKLNHQNEIDIVFKRGSLLIPVDVKSTQTFNPNFFRSLNYLAKLSPDRIKTGFVVYDGQIEQTVGHFEILNFRKVDQIARMLNSSFEIL